ncbi:MAG: PfkB family carbohydrate kinase [Deinococcales bacterium]
MLDKQAVFDLIAIGRSSMDLFAEQVGADFEAVESFSAYVGGSPSNIAVGSSRLGLKVALLTAVGEDKVGDFIFRRLAENGVDTQYSVRKGGRSSLALVAIKPPSHFPLVFYRESAPDKLISAQDVLALPFKNTIKP